MLPPTSWPSATKRWGVTTPESQCLGFSLPRLNTCVIELSTITKYHNELLLQGMTKAAGSLETTPAGIKLWLHEVLRVFFDRLVDDTDRLWLGRTLAELTEKHFKERLTSLLGLTPTAGAAAAASAGGGGTGGGGSRAAEQELLTGLRGLIFGDFMVPGADTKVYREITDQGKMLHVVGEYLSDMNAGSKKPQKLVLFQFALEHVARISAIVSQPGEAEMQLLVLADMSGPSHSSGVIALPFVGLLGVESPVPY